MPSLSFVSLNAFPVICDAACWKLDLDTKSAEPFSFRTEPPSFRRRSQHAKQALGTNGNTKLVRMLSF